MHAKWAFLVWFTNIRRQKKTKTNEETKTIQEIKIDLCRFVQICADLCFIFVFIVVLILWRFYMKLNDYVYVYIQCKYLFCHCKCKYFRKTISRIFIRKSKAALNVFILWMCVLCVMILKLNCFYFVLRIFKWKWIFDENE